MKWYRQMEIRWLKFYFLSYVEWRLNKVKVQKVLSWLPFSSVHCSSALGLTRHVILIGSYRVYHLVKIMFSIDWAEWNQSSFHTQLSGVYSIEYSSDKLQFKVGIEIVLLWLSLLGQLWQITILCLSFLQPFISLL